MEEDPLRELVAWATSRGVELNGIAPQRIPGRGVGVLATRDIKADEIVLSVPTACLRTLSTVPKARVRRLTEAGVSVHGILAADLLAPDSSGRHGSWDAVVPSAEDFASTPLTWPAELQALLPPGARELLEKQRAKFARDWDGVAGAFPDLLLGQDQKGHHTRGGSDRDRERGRERYRHAWLLVNSRTFYYLDATLKRRRGTTADDHMALQPVADLFNHGDEDGCHVAFGGDGFAFRATVDYSAGDEVRICYGRHGGDLLLVEYGFVMARNCWDEMLLDEPLLARLDAGQMERLDAAGFLGRYVLDRETVCHRTQVALRALCCAPAEWARFVDGSDHGEASQGAVDALLLDLLREYALKVDGAIERVRRLEVGEKLQREILTERWLQIRGLLDARIEGLEQEHRA
ncbi:SET domain-containing protein [Nemania sp. NC0429]|nr:SET domain-containing protein [Nemania sp. NC0429]